MNGPVDIMGVIAHPSEARECRFIDSSYNKLFTVPDRENVLIESFDGRETVKACTYIDDYHFALSGSTYHICEFAEIMERNGSVYRPEHPKESDICDTYAIYQLKAPQDISYGFMPFETAKNRIHPSHYEKMYQGVLAPKVTLENLFQKHNRAFRPFGQRMRSLSMSDVVVLNRGGVEKAFYVDQIGFQEAKRFLNPPKRTRKKAQQER